MWIVKIDSVPVLQVGCRAGSELELRGGGGKDLLINFDTTDSRFDFHFLKCCRMTILTQAMLCCIIHVLCCYSVLFMIPKWYAL